MVSMFIELPAAVYEWFDQMAQKNSFDSVNEYIEFTLAAKCAEASQGAVKGAFIYTKDND